MLAILLKVFSQLCLLKGELASSFKPSQSEMVMHDSSRNLFCLQGKQSTFVGVFSNSECFALPQSKQPSNLKLSQPVEGACPCGNATDVPLTSIWSS